MDKETFEVRLTNWTSIVKQCQARPLGQTISQWCNEAGIGEKKYYYWQRKVRRQAVEQMESMLPSAAKSTDDVAFAEVKIPPASSSDHVSSDNEDHAMQFQPDVLIRRGDLVIGVTNKASDRILNRILQEVTHAG